MAEVENAMEHFVTNFMKQQKVLVSYVRTPYGFKKGAVVAFLKTNKLETPCGTTDDAPSKEIRLGWSLVNNRDGEWKYLRPDQLPVIQRRQHLQFRHENEEYLDSKPFKMLTARADVAYKKCIRANLRIRVPKFDRTVALKLAIDRALAEDENKITLTEFGDLEGNLPIDRDIRRAVLETYYQAIRFFKLGRVLE